MKSISIVEGFHLEHDKRKIIDKSKIIDRYSYADRFDELLGAGYSWLNLSIIGILNEELIVGIEIPRESSGVPAGKTSVNMSGPMRFVQKETLDISEYLEIAGSVRDAKERVMQWKNL